jgi:predicted esterase
MPIEPFSPSPGFGAGQFGMSGTDAAGPKITILEGPQRKVSRRGLIRNLLLVTVAGGGAAAWFLSPEGPTDYSKKVQEFRYGPSGARKGALFVPSTAGDEPRPLLVLLEPTRHPQRVVLRFARECEKFGWIAIASDAMGAGVAGSDGAEAAMLLEDARARVKVDGARPFLAGFAEAADVACRLALTQPDVFAGAVLECCGIGPWRDVGALASAETSFFLAARSSDGSREPMVTMKDEMERKGLHVTWDEMHGGHDPRERDELDTAFNWLNQMHG